MDALARAGISIDGKTLRYAEVEHYGVHRRLLRLGSCAFDFEVTPQMLHDGEAAHLKTVSEALRDVFSGSVASELRVALHPPSCCSFFSPLPAELTEAERQPRLRREAALLLQEEADVPFHLRTDALYDETLSDGTAVAWMHALALPRSTHGRFDGLLRGLPTKRYRFGLSTQGAAAVAARAEPEAAERPLTVTIGHYPTHLEYALLDRGTWRFGYHTASGSPVDAAYFTVALLERMGRTPGEVRQVYFYGVDVPVEDADVFSQVFGHAPKRLSPVAAVEVEEGSLTSQFNAEAYAPCVGVTL